MLTIIIIVVSALCGWKQINRIAFFLSLIAISVVIAIVVADAVNSGRGALGLSASRNPGADALLTIALGTLAYFGASVMQKSRAKRRSNQN